MSQYECAPNDLSLISDVSEIGDSGLLASDVAYSRFMYASAAKPNQSRSFASPLPSESSGSSGKQVRFNESVAVTSVPTYSKFIPDRTEPEDTEDVTTVTPLRGTYSESNQDDLRNVCPPRDYYNHCHYTRSSSASDIDAPCSRVGPNEVTSGNTSLWLDTPAVSGPKDLSVKDSPPLSLDTDQGVAFFRTSDHLPRPPMHHNSSNASQPHFTVGGSCFPLDMDSPFPRSPRSPSPAPRSVSLSLSSIPTETMSDRASPTFARSSNEVDLSKPIPNTARLLSRQIDRLTQQLSDHAVSGPCEQARLEAERLVNEACGYSNAHNNQADVYLLNPGLTVNIPEHVSTFTNLMDLSVDESEIVRQERERVAMQRRRMAQLRKQAAKNKVEPPKPDLLEFFDPNRHVFQSVNLHIKGLPSFLPVAKPAPLDHLVTVFHDRMMTDFCRLHL